MKKRIKAILIDDDVTARNILQKFLEDEDKVQVVASLDNTLEAVEIMLDQMPDVIFLDINMPYENGLTFALRMKESGFDTQVVFTTAFRNYALEAFSIKPFDFLVKPFGINEISSLICKLEEHLFQINFFLNASLNKDDSGKLKFKTNHGYLFILPQEIVYIHSVRNYCELYLTSGLVEKVLIPMSSLSKEFKRNNFHMISRSLIINLSYIVRIDRKMKKCVMSSNENEFELPITFKNLIFFENMSTVKLG
jgi:DNA-binding LytR/AlgR family response regulator